MVICLSVHSLESFFEVFIPPDESLYIFVFKKVGVLVDQLLGSDVYILIEESSLFEFDSIVSSEARLPVDHAEA